MEISRTVVGSDRGDIEIFRLVNDSGAWVELSSLGAGIIGLGVPDADGRIGNVALGYGDVRDYIGDGPNMGKSLGRYANRIAHGRFSIGDRTYQLNLNLPPHHLHGGAEGFQNQIWKAAPTGDGVIFSLDSPDGSENYPGNLSVEIRYRWGDDNRLSITFRATTDVPTVLNLSNHAYWNLSGADSGSALGHELKMKVSRYLETDETLVPTGRLLDAAGTPMDFSRFKRLGADISTDFKPLKIGKGYDHCWALDKAREGEMSREAVVIRDPESRRTLTIDSDQPGVQIYTGNWLEGSARNRSGRFYRDYEGLAVEMQGFPDAPNHPGFPSQFLLPGEAYERHITYSFGTY